MRKNVMYLFVGIIVGWLTVGVVLARSWNGWEITQMITILEKIEMNTR